MGFLDWFFGLNRRLFRLFQALKKDAGWFFLEKDNLDAFLLPENLHIYGLQINFFKFFLYLIY